jgi:hypothetical protein
MTELNGTASEEEKIVSITKIFIRLTNNNGHYNSPSPQIFAFNANGIGKQRFELSKQLQPYRIDMAILSETHLKPHERFCIPYYRVKQTDRFQDLKGGTAFAVRKAFLHNHAGLPLFIFIEATGVCTPIGNSKVLLATLKNL